MSGQGIHDNQTNIILINYLSDAGIIEFSSSFITFLIIIGAIGTFFAVLRHTFPKDTVANSVVGIIDSLYSGIYLFYIFGGFSVPISESVLTLKVYESLSMIVLLNCFKELWK